MIFALLGVLLLIAIYAPSLWVRFVMDRYSREDPGIRGTGGELAVHLINRFQLEGVNVEETEPHNDHFDPSSNTVRLSPDNYNGRSLTAIAVAAHEVGHAIQFNRKEAISLLRGQYIPKAVLINKIGIGIVMLMPVVGLITRVPHAAIITAVAGILAMLVSALMYLIVLPEEWDASFNKALPILVEGEYINKNQEQAVNKVLRAAALTYFAAALANILSLWRWLILLRLR
ncbi:zinc metallopeptidase [Kaarinaea lacus]